jgi:two-component system, chemotaxis family, chemotaxis protein CheY
VIVAPQNILIVDDDSDIREAVADALVHEGHQVQMAANGREALDWLKGVPLSQPLPGLILLDLMMPILDGRGFLRELRKLNRLALIPVFVFSAHDDAIDVAAALKTAGFLRKPLRMDDLLGVVQTAATNSARSA